MLDSVVFSFLLAVLSGQAGKSAGCQHIFGNTLGNTLYPKPCKPYIAQSPQAAKGIVASLSTKRQRHGTTVHAAVVMLHSS